MLEHSIMYAGARTLKQLECLQRVVDAEREYTMRLVELVTELQLTLGDLDGWALQIEDLARADSADDNQLTFINLEQFIRQIVIARK